jgi:hypothetical protein
MSGPASGSSARSVDVRAANPRSAATACGEVAA